MGDGDDGFGTVALAIIGVLAWWWIGSWLASFVFDQGWLRADPMTAITAGWELRQHLRDPRAAWPERWRSHLPGPVPYYLSLVGAMLMLVPLFGAFRNFMTGDVGQRKRRRLGQRVRGRFAKRRELATLEVDRDAIPAGRLLVAQSGRPWWQRKLDPRGEAWLATECRALGEMPHKLRWWRRWWFRRHQYDRGAVMIMGPSRSGKTVTTLAAAMRWQGPMIGSSVKSDQVAALGPIRGIPDADTGRFMGVKVFDPTVSVGDVIASRFEVGSWSPVKAGMSFTDAMRSGKSLSDALADDGGGGGGNEKFFREQASQLITGVVWVAAQMDRLATELGLPEEGMARVGRWMMGSTPWVDTSEPPEEDLSSAFAEVQFCEWVDASEWDRARDLVRKVWFQAQETRGGIYGSAQNMVWPWQNPKVEAAASTCDIDIGWILGDDQTEVQRREEPRSLFIVAPPSDMKRYAPVFAGSLNDLIEQVVARFNATGKPLDPPLLVLIDEAGNTPIKDLPDYASTVAGMGVILCCAYQSYAQIKSQYGDRTGTLIANFLTKVLFAAQSDEETLELFAKLVGEEEVVSTSLTDGSSDARDSRQRSTSVTSMTPMAMLRTMRVGDALMLHGTLPPVWARWVPWFRHPAFKAEQERLRRFEEDRAVAQAQVDASIAAVTEAA